MMALQRPMPSSANHDTSDLDRYINYDQSAVPSPSGSPASASSKSTFVPSVYPDPSSTTYVPIEPSSQPVFAAPSHQYAAYPQNNGLPVGALADIMATNRSGQSSSRRHQQYYGNSVSTSFGLSPVEDFEFDFGSNYDMSCYDMDVDFSTAPQSGLGQSTDVEYVDPSAIGGQEATVAAPQPQAPRRAYPGMHQQQALAKARAEAQQQKEREAAAQQQQKAAASQGRTGRSPADPIVEERITRIINEMRHSSVASSKDEEAAIRDQGSAALVRQKKEEDEMDEDERLLASEEGKKLSSKERRQLRNKVSARAFRSRRKEYIGQLEGEIATKTAEADELRAKNQELVNENAQLLSLTRTLLSSPAFSDFLNISGMPSVTDSSEPAHSSNMKTEEAGPVVPKDANPNRVSSQQVDHQQQDAPYIGITLLPEHTFDLTAYNTNSNSWTGNVDLGPFDTQVFSVTSIPEGPAIDEFQLANLSGKPPNTIGFHARTPESKNQAPSIERMALAVSDEAYTEPIVASDDDVFDESDPAFLLYSDCPAPTKNGNPKPAQAVFGRIGLEKALGRVELILEDEEADPSGVSTAAMDRFRSLCWELEELSDRVTAVVPHV